LTCPADGWLTLNAGARAQSEHTNAACGAFPAVQPAGAGASVPGLPALETYNHQFHNNPDWGLLSQQTPGCATAAGPGAALALADGPGYSAGLLNAASTRQPGLVVLTDLTPTVLGWLGRTVPPQTVGAHVTRGDRGSLAATVQSLTGRDTAEQVWRDTHDEFFWAYSLADAAVLAAIGLTAWGAAQDQRRRRARRWGVAGVFP